MREFERSALVTGAGELWREGTTAKFLAGIGDGTLPPEAFGDATGTAPFVAIRQLLSCHRGADWRIVMWRVKNPSARSR